MVSGRVTARVTSRPAAQQPKAASHSEQASMVLVRICIRSVWSSGGRAGAAEYGRSSGTGSLRPGLIAAVTVKGLGAKTGDLQFDNSVPILIPTYLPNGMLGIAITGLLAAFMAGRSEEHTSELQSRQYLVCRLLLEK